MSGEAKADGNANTEPDLDIDQGKPASDDIFTITSYTQRPPLPRPFRPWHKPRKQIVREEQWGQEVDWILSCKPPGDNSLRYLGLPGMDLLDLRYLYDRFCKGGSHKLTFLGFEESAKPTSRYSDALNVSLHEVRSLEYVDRQSEILGDDFRLLADDNSIAWDMAQRLGPFDAINIDLCDHMVHDEPTIDLSIYNAIHHICGLQYRRSQPWTLLLTSRLNKDNIAPDAFILLLNALAKNFGRCAEFTSAFEDQLGIHDVSLSVAEAWDDSDFFTAMTVALAKWLLRLAQSMRCIFSISSTIGYRVWSAAPYLDMLSIVCRFEPAISIPADSLGLASASPVFPSECAQAAMLPDRVSHLVDIDDVLKVNGALWELFRDKTADLLSQARYDPEAYRRWADDKRNSS